MQFQFYSCNTDYKWLAAQKPSINIPIATNANSSAYVEIFFIFMFLNCAPLFIISTKLSMDNPKKSLSPSTCFLSFFSAFLFYIKNQTIVIYNPILLFIRKKDLLKQIFWEGKKLFFLKTIIYYTVVVRNICVICESIVKVVI